MSVSTGANVGRHFILTLSLHCLKVRAPFLLINLSVVDISCCNVVETFFSRFVVVISSVFKLGDPLNWHKVRLLFCLCAISFSVSLFLLSLSFSIPFFLRMQE